jgi:hypothetical protein
MRALAAVRWSRSLRAVLFCQTAEPEQTDAELAAGDVNGKLVISFPLIVWSRLRCTGLDHAMLVAAEYGGLAAVNAVIASQAPQQFAVDDYCIFT